MLLLDACLSDDIVPAPRFIAKFISSVYFPLDKDIVREMWVLGDLKDQLGIGHRKANKGRKESNSKSLEATPMFQHHRSNSDASISDPPYEPTTGRITPRSPSSNYMDTPSISATRDSPAQNTYLSPQPSNRGDLPPSPGGRIPSYYSASDLPSPSPLPDPVYRYPTGELTTTPPSPRASLSSKASPRRSHAQMPSTSSQFGQGPYNPMQLPESGSHNHPEVFELHVRTPSDDLRTPYSQAFERSTSSASYVTAGDGYHLTDDGVSNTLVSPYDGGHLPHAPSVAQMWSSEDDHTPVAGSYDHSSIAGSHSASASWEGPTAL